MSNAPMDNVRAEQLARRSLKQLIRKYNLSHGGDKEALQKILDHIASTPLYVPFAKDSKPGNMQVITLTTPEAVFVPVFTSQIDFGKVAESADIKLMSPKDFIPMIVELGHHLVVNPFGEYFLLWPELMREHMLPYLEQYNSFVDTTFTSPPKN